MVTPLRAVEDGVLTSAECEELLYIHRSCSAMGYRPGVQSTHLGHLVASNTAALLLPILPVRERIRDLVEQKSGHHCMVFIEFTGLISWTAGSSIGWHHDSNREYLSQRHYSAVCYLNDYGMDFTGGLFHFQEGEPSTITPLSGRVAIYSAGEENVHSVDPVLSGERCTLTMWFTLDRTHDEDSLLIPRLLDLPDRRDYLSPSDAELASPDWPTNLDTGLFGRGAMHEVFVQHRVPLPLEISASMYASAVSSDAETHNSQTTPPEAQCGQSKPEVLLSSNQSVSNTEGFRKEPLTQRHETSETLVETADVDVGSSRGSRGESRCASGQQLGSMGVEQEVRECRGLAVHDLRDEKLRELGVMLKERENDGLLVLEDGVGGSAHVFANSLHVLQVAFFCEWQGASLAALAASREAYDGMPCHHLIQTNDLKRQNRCASRLHTTEEEDIAIFGGKRARFAPCAPLSSSDSTTTSIRVASGPQLHHEHEPQPSNHPSASELNTSALHPANESLNFGVELECQTSERGHFSPVETSEAPFTACTPTTSEDGMVVRSQGLRNAIAAWECYVNRLWKRFSSSLSSWQSTGFLYGIHRSSNNSPF